MALPAFDNHDGRIKYYELMLEADITGMAEIPLPEGYSYVFYQDGGEFWLGFYFEEGAELTELYSGQDGERHFVREAVG